MTLRRSAAESFLKLCDTMARLRSPTGCPWDREQTVKTLRSYLLEESHEVLEILDLLDEDGGSATTPGLVEKHKDELGDLMLQIVFQSEIQAEAQRFDVGDVCEAITAKLIRRHPHIFSDAPPEGVPGSKEGWEAIKRKERAAAGEAAGEKKPSALDGVPKHLPALLRAYRTGEKARAAHFDWPDHKGVVEKIKEELSELEEALAEGNKERTSAELGDILYALTNLARHKEIDPESALRSTITRFEGRFRLVEELLEKEGKIPEKCTLDELEEKWQAAKKLIAGQEAAAQQAANPRGPGAASA